MGQEDREILERMEVLSTEAELGSVDSNTKRVARELFYLLSMTCKKRALKEARKVSQGNGLEARRRLYQRYGCGDVRSATGLLQQILQVRFSHDIEKFEDELVTWELSVQEHDTLPGATEVSESTKRAIISA
eukprot:5360055-Alexandrium_andersonii.AAC.1